MSDNGAPPRGTHRRRRPPPYEAEWQAETGDAATFLGEAMYVRAQAVGHVLDTLAQLRTAHERAQRECARHRDLLEQQQAKIERLRRAFVERERAYQRLRAQLDIQEGHAAA